MTYRHQILRNLKFGTLPAFVAAEKEKNTLRTEAGLTPYTIWSPAFGGLHHLVLEAHFDSMAAFEKEHLAAKSLPGMGEINARQLDCVIEGNRDGSAPARHPGAQSLMPEALRWYQWHSQYDDLESADTARLEVVQDVLASVLTDAGPGELLVVSACAGQSRDLLPVLINHPRGQDVSARLLELDPLNAAFLHSALGSTALTGIDVVVADAGRAEAYRGAVPADLVLFGGVFANTNPDDTFGTIDALPALCRTGGVVVWSSYGARLSGADDIVARLESGPFDRESLYRTDEFVVGAHRHRGAARELPDGRFFSFT